MMKVQFWGVRGSIATSGPQTQRVGGNTSCVAVEADGHLVILDAGTGLRGLGAQLLGRGRHIDATLLLSHFHWDHIQGFPFFGPAYVPTTRLAVIGPERSAPGGEVRAVFEQQMRAPHFPVGLDALRARLSFGGMPAGGVRWVGGGAARIEAAAACHPNGCLAYRVEAGGRSVVYATDTEHDARSGELDARLLGLARGADVLIYDAQYTATEYEAGKRGWGHSTVEEATRLAAAAGVGQLVLFHHDPCRSDADVEQLEREAQDRFSATVAAREGLEVRLDRVERDAA